MPETVTNLPMWFECPQCKRFSEFTSYWESLIERMLSGEVNTISLIHSECMQQIKLTAMNMCWQDGSGYKTVW